MRLIAAALSLSIFAQDPTAKPLNTYWPYEIELIRFPEASTTSLNGVNRSGDIVGHYGKDGKVFGFTLIRGVFQTVEYPGAIFTAADDINDAQDVFGEYIDASGTWHGFLKTAAGGYYPIDFPGASSTQVLGTSNNGDIVGNYVLGGLKQCPQDPADPAVCNAFILNGNTFRSIEFPGAQRTQAFGVNNAGAVVGIYLFEGRFHGFKYEFGRFTTIDPPGARATQCIGINSRGDIVGSFVAGDTSRGFLYSRGRYSVIPETTIANRINDAGTIAAERWTNSSVVGILAKPTSVPGDWALRALEP